MTNRTNVRELAVGDRLSRVSYMEVIRTSTTSVTVRNEEGLEWSIGNSIVAAEAFSADQYTAEVPVSRTQMVNLLENAGDTTFTVVFDKKINKRAIVDAIGVLMDSGDASVKALSAAAKDLLSGEERTLVGYLVNSEPKMGRSTVVDLTVPTDKHRLRLVDHRTIKSLVLKNVLYVLKK